MLCRMQTALYVRLLCSSESACLREVAFAAHVLVLVCSQAPHGRLNRLP